MTLQSTQSIWDKAAEPPAYPALRDTVTADVVIVGAGLTGITAAALLAEAGKQVVVLDAKRVGSGVTGGTTAHLTAVLDTRFHVIESDFGAEGAKLAARAHTEAIARIAALARQYTIDCDYREVPGFLYTEHEEQIEEIEKEYEALRRVGFEAKLLHHLDLPFPVRRAIRIENQAQFHPLKYVYGLAEAITARGVRIFEQSAVTKVEDNDDGAHIETEGGAVTAGAVFMATHIPPGLSVADTLVAPYRSYVMACTTGTPPPPGLYWDTEDPYHYARTHSEHGQTWLIVGGEDHKTGEEEDTGARFARLEAYARERYPIQSVEARWSAQVYEPVDGLAYIGQNPGTKHTYYATGYAGNGMTYGTVAARLVSDLILGNENPYAELFSPARFKPLASAQEFLKENVNVAAHRIGDYLHTDSDTFAAVPTGEGQIVKVDGQQVAAYRADDGTLHTLSPVCTHLGCRVAWNSAENTWDCPCHGGRFKATGEWLEGPPMHPLERIEVES